jgi:hypothetical protein
MAMLTPLFLTGESTSGHHISATLVATLKELMLMFPKAQPANN